VKSIEDLADANEEFLGRIGMGARRLKAMAHDWVEANRTQGPIIAQMDTLRRQLEEQAEQIKELKEANAALGQQVIESRQQSVGSRFPVGLPSPEERLSEVRDNAHRDEAEALDDVLGS
jgi:hypothetical protein